MRINWGPGFSVQVLLQNILNSVAIEEEKFMTFSFCPIFQSKSWSFLRVFGSRCFFLSFARDNIFINWSLDMDTIQYIKTNTYCTLRLPEDALVQSSPVTRFVNTSLIADNMWFRFFLWIWVNAPNERCESVCEIMKSGLSSYLRYFLVALHN
jgi:hypothetical protein